MRAGLVNGDTLARVARQLGIGHEVLLGEGEMKSGGADRASILADALEAVFGAVYLDGGFDAARRVIVTCYAQVLRDVDPGALGKDPKTRLQEWLQARRWPVPEYAVTATSGDPHEQRFTVECRIPKLGDRDFRRRFQSPRGGAGGCGRRQARWPRLRSAEEPEMASDVEAGTGGSSADGAAPKSFRCGHVAIVGRPSVGKSTLLNALVGQKISITSKKPQTTRYRITGIATDAQAQFVFVDTPGFQTKHRSRLNDRLNRAVRESLADVDAVVLVLDATRITPADLAVVALLPRDVPVIAAVNKVDTLADKAAFMGRLAELAQLHPFAAIVPVSAEKGTQLAGAQRRDRESASLV